MELYIRIRDGQIVDHPLFKENLEQAYPGINLTNNSEFIPFERIPAPPMGAYDKEATVHYEIINGIAKDVWTIESMSEEEKLEKQNQVKLHWQENGFPSWTFNEAICKFEPPVPYPNDGNMYYWNEQSQSWDLVTG